jgi:CRP-like cAMP-binding protein
MIDLDKLKQIYKFGKHLNLDDVQQLLKAAKTTTFEKKELIISQGSIKNDVFFIATGLVRQYNISTEGEETSFRIIPENFFAVNVNAILFNQPSNYYFEAIERTKTYSINYELLQNILQKSTNLTDSRGQFYLRMMKEMFSRIESFVMLNPEERYLKFIKDYPDIDQRVSDKHIASVLGITPVSLSRIRGRIADK